MPTEMHWRALARLTCCRVVSEGSLPGRSLEYNRSHVGDGTASPTTTNFVISEVASTPEHDSSTMVNEHSTTVARGTVLVAHHRVFVEGTRIREVHLLVEVYTYLRMMGNGRHGSGVQSMFQRGGHQTSVPVEGTRG